MKSDLKVAVVHDWLIGMRGGEKVLKSVCELFPKADIHTLLYNPDYVAKELKRMNVRTSWLQRLPFVHSYYRYLLPLMPLAIRSFDLSEYDLVISSSHCVAKGATLRGNGHKPLHICYCHTPMRYLHYQFENYFHQGSLAWLKPAATLFRPWLAYWDRESSRQVDEFVANSENVRARIAKTYGRESAVIYPPVDTDFFSPLPCGGGQDGGSRYYLIVGALVPYKRVDLAIEACRSLRVPLKVIGVGSDEDRLHKLARGADVEFLGWQTGHALRSHYQRCAAMLYPQEEDFGISAVEAMSCGAPIIAFNKGGALETVEDGVTGVFFSEQTVASLAAAINRAAAIGFDRAAIRARAERFDTKLFQDGLRKFLTAAWGEHRPSLANRLTAAVPIAVVPSPDVRERVG